MSTKEITIIEGVYKEDSYYYFGSSGERGSRPTIDDEKIVDLFDKYEKKKVRVTIEVIE